jgi:hypothetical protein
MKEHWAAGLTDIEMTMVRRSEIKTKPKAGTRTFDVHRAEQQK